MGGRSGQGILDSQPAGEDTAGRMQRQACEAEAHNREPGRSGHTDSVCDPALIDSINSISSIARCSTGGGGKSFAARMQSSRRRQL